MRPESAGISQAVAWFCLSFGGLLAGGWVVVDSGVPSELLFHVAGPSAHAAEPISLAEPGLRERADLQEWVLKYPQMQLPGNVRLQVVVKRRLTVISRWKTGARIAQ